jgi:hypothetical protein
MALVPPAVPAHSAPFSPALVMRASAMSCARAIEVALDGCRRVEVVGPA